MADTLPNTKPKGRWLQFSIRTVLVIVTLLCVGLSIWVAAAERPRRAVAAIKELGGRLGCTDKAGSGESFPIAFLRRWLPQAYFDEVVSVELGNTQVTDAGLAHLEGVTELQLLYLGNTQITDAGLVHLEGLTELRSLGLTYTQVTGAGLAKLRKAMPNCRIDGS
jgi:hypothetical protein